MYSLIITGAGGAGSTGLGGSFVCFTLVSFVSFDALLSLASLVPSASLSFSFGSSGFLESSVFFSSIFTGGATGLGGGGG